MWATSGKATGEPCPYGLVGRRNAADSPWYRKVRLVGQPASPEQVVRHHTMVASLEPVLKDAFLKRLTDDDCGRILLNYWYAIRQRWPVAFVEPRDYRVQKTVGVYSLHMAFPDVAQLCRETNDFSSNRIYEILGESGIAAEFWSATHGHPLVKETGAKYMRALGEYIRERLPRLELAKLT